jgi:predicted DCC family thiol-disulfide oxidoreductase YuxK
MAESAVGDVVVYDGECGFCGHAIRVVDDHLPLRPELQPYQTARLSQLGLSEAEVRRAMWFVSRDGERSEGAMALAQWLRRSGGRWRLLGQVIAAPGVRTLASASYRVIARNRRRIPGPWEHTCRT